MLQEKKPLRSTRIKARFNFNGPTDGRYGWCRSHNRNKKDLPHIKVVMLTSFIEDKEVYRALDAGVDSYILKQQAQVILLKQYVKHIKVNQCLNLKYL